MKNMPTGDGHGFGVVLAVIVFILGIAAVVSHAGLGRAAYLANRAIHGR